MADASIGLNKHLEGTNIVHPWGTEVMLECYVREQGVPVTGLHPYVTIYRHSDEYVLDYNTDTFVPMVYPYNYEKLIPLTEFADGLYTYSFDQAKYVLSSTVSTGTYEGEALNEAYSLVYRVSYTRNGKYWTGSDFELHMFGIGLDRYMRILYDQHRRLLHKHKQFDPRDMEDYRYCKAQP